jgi:26S proteasome non-ATPase regulatory subunit 9
VTGKWVVKNWDGSVAGVNGGDQFSFNDLSQNRDIIPDKTELSRTTVPVGVDESTSSNPSSSSSSSSSRRPFAKVDGVTHPSPAADAGMKVDDLIIRFGPLHFDNNDRLRAVAMLVPGVAEVNGKIQISVLRRRQEQSTSTSTSENDNVDYNDETQWEQAVLILHPRPFSGRGVLGCHIVPF